MIILCLALFICTFSAFQIPMLKDNVDHLYEDEIEEMEEIDEIDEIEEMEEMEEKTPSIFKKYTGRNIEGVFQDVLIGKNIFLKNSEHENIKYFDYWKCEDILEKYKYSTIKEIYMLECWTNAIEVIIL